MCGHTERAQIKDAHGQYVHTCARMDIHPKENSK